MNETQLRDALAAERTHLANERTLLAYVRTALALAGAGAVLLQFFPSHPSLYGIAWLLVAAGGAMLIVGTHRFLIVRRRLHGQVWRVPLNPRRHLRASITRWIDIPHYRERFSARRFSWF